MEYVMKTMASLLLFGVLLPMAAAAQGERPASLLVLDASGSMWGQVGGRTKIEIAREAADAMLQTWDARTDLGLMAYGHRRKGDCTDIELLQPVGAFDADAIRARIAALRPIGMTPIADSVRQAALALRHAERKASVILVSDGEETCSADPCAVGAELEASGVDFTAHVIGFDLESNPKAREQLQCLARATGGRYVDARNAGELSVAMQDLAAAPPPAPVPEPPRACGRFTGAQTWMPGMATWPTGGQAGDLADDRRKAFEPLELAQSAQPQECRQRCDDDEQCTAWWFEPVGSNFRTQPVCFRWDGATALSPPQPGPEGSAMGIKAGVRQIALEDGESCVDAAPEKTQAIRFNEGCTAWDQEDFAGNSMQMGGASGLRISEVPDPWRTGIKSLSCQQGCSILVFTEAGYDGENFSIPDGAHFARMPEDYRRPFGAYEVGCTAMFGEPQ
jgi:Ca-activated chloride channel family protein